MQPASRVPPLAAGTSTAPLLGPLPFPQLPPLHASSPAAQCECLKCIILVKHERNAAHSRSSAVSNLAHALGHLTGNPEKSSPTTLDRELDLDGAGKRTPVLLREKGLHDGGSLGVQGVVIVEHEDSTDGDDRHGHAYEHNGAQCVE